MSSSQRFTPGSLNANSIQEAMKVFGSSNDYDSEDSEEFFDTPDAEGPSLEEEDSEAEEESPEDADDLESEELDELEEEEDDLEDLEEDYDTSDDISPVFDGPVTTKTQKEILSSLAVESPVQGKPQVIRSAIDPTVVQQQMPGLGFVASQPTVPSTIEQMISRVEGETDNELANRRNLTTSFINAGVTVPDAVCLALCYMRKLKYGITYDPTVEANLAELMKRVKV